MSIPNTFSKHPEVKNGFLKLEGSYTNYKIFVDDEYKLHVTDLRENGFGEYYYKDPIKKYGFDDLESILITSRVPFGVYDVIDVTNIDSQDGKTTLLISQNELLKNDYDPKGESLFITHLAESDRVKTSVISKQLKIDITDSTTNLKYFRYSIGNAKSFENTFLTPVFIKTKNEPNDPSYFKQTYLWEIEFNNIWKEYSGKGVKIAIYDQGFVPDHSDLEISKDTYYSNFDHPYFKFGQHALMVASIIGAKTNNGIGISGIASSANITSHQLPFGESKKISMKFALNYDIVNNSWGSRELNLDQNLYPIHYDILNAEIENAIVSGRGNLGTNIVFASGNSNLIGHDTNADYTHQSALVINVGGSKEGAYSDLFPNKQLHSFPTNSANILVAAPATNIATLMGRDLNFDENVELSSTSSDINSHGTSFAAPIVSGIIALMLEANPNLGFRDVKKILALSATPHKHNNVNSATFYNGGGFLFNRKHGFGVVNAKNAVKLAESWTKISAFSNMKIYSEYSSSFMHAIISQDVKVNGENAKRFTLSKKLDANIEIEALTLELKATFPDILSNIDIDLISPLGTRATLLSRFGYSKILNKSFIDSSLNSVNWKFSTQNFLGEHYAGEQEWKVEFILYSDTTQSFSDLLKKISDRKAEQTHVIVEFFDLKLFGSSLRNSTDEVFFSPLIFSPYLTNKNLVIEGVEVNERTYIGEDQNLKILNIAMMEAGIKTRIDLSAETTSMLGSLPLAISVKHQIKTIKGGDSDDEMIGSCLDNIFYPSRGNDKLTLGGGSNKIVYPNVNLSNLGTDIVTDFDPTLDIIALGKVENFEAIKTYITYENGNAVIDINSLKLILEGVTSLTETNFEFI